ncbi:MAG: hypothetical protein Q9225_002966 [Loekoesia sp. 1 TL-2023]
MGKFEEIDRYTFRVGTEGNHCELRGLELTNSEEAHERVLVVASLGNLGSENRAILTAIPVSGAHYFSAVDVRKRISSAAHEIAESFGFKEDVQAEAPFRLIHRDSRLCEDVPTKPLPSFIALSYCWHSASWDTDRDVDNLPATATNFAWPIAKSMVKALLLERRSSNEGIWIDQCCINQDDPQEKSRTIGFMNLIYKQARVVVVALEDVVIDQAESVFLESLMKKCSSLRPPNPGILLEETAVHHINHVFLIGVNTLGHNQPKVLRLTLLFLASLVTVITSYDYFGAKDRHHRDLVAHLQTISQRGFLHIILNPFGLGAAYNLDDLEDDPSTQSYMKSLVETLRNCSKFGATVAADRLAITLNVVGSELYYKGPERPEHECGLLLSVAALAAGDPTVLCCSGPKYELPDQSGKYAWLQRPESLDFAGIAGRQGTHRRLYYVPSFTLEQITLDFFQVASTLDTSIQSASEPFLTRARWYIDGCIEMSKIDHVFQLGGTLADKKATKVELLACALECGPQWINKAAAAKTSADYPDPDLERAIEVFISISSMQRNFQELTEEHRDLYEMLIDFVETLTLDYVSPIGTPAWAPAWVSIGPGEMDRLLFMCPADGQQYIAVIPTLLQHTDYTNCKRMFMLKTVPRTPDFWTVIGKSLVFGTDLSVLTPQHSKLRERQVIQA